MIRLVPPLFVAPSFTNPIINFDAEKTYNDSLSNSIRNNFFAICLILDLESDVSSLAPSFETISRAGTRCSIETVVHYCQSPALDSETALSQSL